MSIQAVIAQAQEYLSAQNISGWLLYDYRNMNPIFWDTVGIIPNVTRPCWLWIAADAPPQLLVSYVDQGRFTHLGIETALFVSRQDMTAKLGEMLASADRIAMEYSPQGALPRVSRIDAGTLELVRSFGVEVVSSADLLQHATQRWDDEQLRSHLAAANALGKVVQQAFRAHRRHDRRLSNRVRHRGVHQAAVRRRGHGRHGRAGRRGDAHAADPHFEPTEENSSVIRRGDWVLIDLWTRQPHEDAMFADITWTAYVGDCVPARHQQVFDAVIGDVTPQWTCWSRRTAEGRTLEGWQLDAAAREYITQAGFGDYFNHRLGHSLGREVHSNAVNLDGWETQDTRKLIPGIAVTVEPGIYLPGEFGVRSEIDLFMGNNGPQITTQVQRDVVLIDA